MKRLLPTLPGSGLILVAMILVLALPACAPDRDQPAASPTADPARYAFLVAGHTYGVPGVDTVGVHAPFRAWFPEINAQGLDLAVFTGDVVIESTEVNWDEIDADLEQLHLPVYIAAGNHDLINREVYALRHGATYYRFEHQGDLFVVLDSYLADGNIVGEQFDFLVDALSEVKAPNVFLFVHQLIWVTEDTPYFELKDRLNTDYRYDFANNFWSDVAPLLRELDAEVYVIAGDVGVSWAMPLFHEYDQGIHLVASGMGGSEEENYLIFDVRPGGVRIQAQRLDGKPLSLGSVEAYDLAHYRAEAASGQLANPGEIQPLDYRFGPDIELVGYALSAADPMPGGSLPLRLYWQADVTPSTDYTVFAHVVDSRGTVVTQKDGMPKDGAAPTSQWAPGEQVEDLRLIPLPSDMAVGEYRLLVGLYNLQTMERLPVHGPSGAEIADGAVVLDHTVLIGP
jgi:hypothetical protein